MKINIYYGGRGHIGDPSLYVVNKMAAVFEELNVTVEKFKLQEQKNSIITLPQTLKDADGIILASTVEWHGVGGYIHSFLDACWLYGDKERIGSVYMAPVVMSTSYGEKEAELDLIKAWVTLGGPVAEGMSGYIEDASVFEQNSAYNELIEKCAENIYRTISQKRISLPISTQVLGQTVSKTKPVFLTPQENEQLSEYFADDKYVNQQKQDIKDLASLFKGKLDSAPSDSMDSIISNMRKMFTPQAGMQVRYKLIIEEKGRAIAIRIDRSTMEIKEGDVSYPDCTLTLKENMLLDIVAGKKTFQGGFMEGKIVAKGDFKNLKILDDLFPFMK